jgi:hypothetical protein
MPYISQSDRKKFEEALYLIRDGEGPETAGELNYLITQIILSYVSNKGENYQHYNDVLGALEGAKLELYRKKIANYEEKKIIQNGDL